MVAAADRQAGLAPGLWLRVWGLWSCGCPSRRRGPACPPDLSGRCLSQIQDIVRRRQLLTVFREGKDGQQDVDVAILQALLKGEGRAARGERELCSEGPRGPGLEGAGHGGLGQGVDRAGLGHRGGAGGLGSFLYLPFLLEPKCSRVRWLRSSRPRVPVPGSEGQP